MTKKTKDSFNKKASKKGSASKTKAPAKKKTKKQEPYRGSNYGGCTTMSRLRKNSGFVPGESW